MHYFWIETAILTSFPLLIIAFSMSSGSAASTPTIPIATSTPLKKVVVVGGTHGNEYTGVWCIKALDLQQTELSHAHPALNISTILGHPRAHLANKRFLDNDLNRQFSFEALFAPDDPSTHSIERIRALELDRILGPKFTDVPSNPNNLPPSTDVIIDLHTTTGNMGATIIVAEGDSLMTDAAAYVMHRCGSEDGGAVRCILHTHPNRQAQPNLLSIAKHGFTVEVGPVPTGTLRHDVVEKTQRVLKYALEYLQKQASDPDGVREELGKMYQRTGGRVPCFRTARAVREGEMSGKITWESFADNENLPMVMVHKDVQDEDFREIRTGDALFVDLEGNTIEYDGSHGSPIHLIFINEAGYYYKTSGTGISVVHKAEYGLGSGKFVKEKEEKRQCDSTSTVECL